MKNMTRKNKITIALALVLVVALAIGGTLAYLTSRTQEKKNQFTFVSAGDEGDDKDMTVEIYEPDWDGDYPDDYDDTTIPDKLGEDEAKNIVPGRKIPKNPFLYNSSKIQGLEEWMAITVAFWTNDTTPEPLTAQQLEEIFEDEDYITIDYDLTNWKLVRTYTETVTEGTVTKYLYVYQSKVVAGDWSEPLFTSVDIDIEAPNTFMNYLADFGGFDIRLEGYAIQGEGVSLSQAETLFADMGNATSIFDDTNR